MIQTLIALSAINAFVNGHARWKCPLPRDELDDTGKHIKFENTGNKYAPCGPKSGIWGYGTVTSFKPGWTTIVWEESVSHKGSPFRIALLDDKEKERMILLDHIPHNDETEPDENVESTYAPYRISIYIPDVNCPKCTLQLLYPMTDKSTLCGIPTCYYNPDDAACKGSMDLSAETCRGAPNSNPCIQPNECFSNYHSCTDVVIKGTHPITSFSLDQQPVGWPFATLPKQFYSLEKGTWKGSWLQVPTMSPSYAPFVTDFATLACDRGTIYKSSGNNINTSTGGTSAAIIGILIAILAFASVILLIRRYYNHGKPFNTNHNNTSSNNNNNVFIAMDEKNYSDSEHLVSSERESFSISAAGDRNSRYN